MCFSLIIYVFKVSCFNKWFHVIYKNIRFNNVSKIRSRYIQGDIQPRIFSIVDKTYPRILIKLLLQRYLTKNNVN